MSRCKSMVFSKIKLVKNSQVTFLVISDIVASASLEIPCHDSTSIPNTFVVVVVPVIEPTTPEAEK